MKSIHVDGGIFLNGEVEIQGSKNAVLPLLSATLLIHGTCVIYDCPKIADVYKMIHLMKCMGSKIHWLGNALWIDNRILREAVLPKREVAAMRSSILLTGSLLARFGKVSMEYPGGCVIGRRPVDMHINSLRMLGAKVQETGDGFQAVADQLIGAVIELPFPSVGVTENLLLASVTAQGMSIIENAAREPEIVALCEFLQLAGARIHGVGSSVLVIEGVEQLQECRFHAPKDRIVAGTYLLACMAAGGDIFLKGAPGKDMKEVLSCIEKMGGDLHIDEKGIFLHAEGHCKALPYVQTRVYPGFPTDLQSQLMAVLCCAEGNSIIAENIFENRFRIVDELNAMGAKITVRNQEAYIEGVEYLSGTSVKANELRGGAALVIAGLMAKGTTIVENVSYIERGYVNIGKDLRELGARIYCV